MLPNKQRARAKGQVEERQACEYHETQIEKKENDPEKASLEIEEEAG